MKQKENARQMDMLHGSLLNKILLVALPLAASSMLQQLFNAADTAVVGRFAGSEALAAVGGTSAVISLLINLFVGLSVGANVVIANYIGQGKTDKIQGAVHTSLSLALASGLLLLVVGLVTAEPILRLINTPAEVLDLAVEYLMIYYVGMPFIMIYNFGSAILRSIGDTRKPLYCLLASGVVNVGLNLLLVIVFQMSVAGVAIATVISNIISAGMIFIFLLKTDERIRLHVKKLAFHKEQTVRILRIGVPAGLQGAVFSVSNVCIQTAVNGFGASATAGSAAALNYEYFTFFLINAFSQAAVTFTSQNFGAGEFSRCKRIFKLTLISGIIGTVCMSMVFVIWRDFFAGIFTTSEQAMEFATSRMLHVLSLYFLLPIYEITSGVLRGMCYSMLPAMLTILGTCVLRIAWIYTVAEWIPEFGMLMNVYPVSWVVTCVLVITAYMVIRKKAFRSRSDEEAGAAEHQ